MTGEALTEGQGHFRDIDPRLAAGPPDRLVVRAWGSIAVGAAVFVVFGGTAAWFAVSALPQPYRAVGGAVAVLTILGFLARLAASRVEIDRDGVRLVGVWRRRHLPWSRILEIYVASTHQPEPNPTIQMRVYDPGGEGDAFDIHESANVYGEKRSRLVRTINAQAALNGIASSVTEAKLVGRELGP